MCVGLLSLAGCTAEAAPRAGCDVDDDCAAGLYCDVGGCRADCRLSTDCVALGAAAVCTARGRCALEADGGVDAGSTTCTDDSQCADDVFCNGTEACSPGAPFADAHGCVRTPLSCSAAECDEAAHTCDPCRSADDDHDGYDDVHCGGNDCDDTNALINPAGNELCDTGAVDEDCNPATHGAAAEDQDGDGYWPPATPSGTPCCNGTACGKDCADIPSPDNFASDRWPGARETCNGFDDDCNTEIDDVSTLVYVDCDGDGFGDNARLGRAGCPAAVTPAECPTGAAGARWVDVAGDCDDSRAATHPGATDECNGIDDDCVAPTDPATCACNGTEPARSHLCGYSPNTVDRCTAVWGTCSSGAWLCPVGLITGGEPEGCDGIDNNCNTVIDEGVKNACGTCGTVPTEVCDGRDNDCDGLIDEGMTNRCGTCGTEPVEVCDGIDNNCNGTIDEGMTNACGRCGAVPAEVCDGRDNDCNGVIDDIALRPVRPDADGDGVCGSTDETWVGCTIPAGYSTSCTTTYLDCNDNNRYATSPCSYTGSSGSFGHCCCLGCGQPNPFSIAFPVCSPGWHVIFCLAAPESGSGISIASPSPPYMCQITQSCNGCDGASAHVNYQCVADATAP